MYYIAYGSNLDLRLMKRRCPSAVCVGATILPNYTLAFKGDFDENAYLTIEEQADSIVPVGVFELAESDIRLLDQYEGYPLLYGRKKMTLAFQGQEIQGIVYVMNRDFDYHLPAIPYFQSCVRGYRDFQFDNCHLVDALNRTENLKNAKGRLS